jgi:ABC-type transporter Mla subunit MlaD
MSPGVTAAVIAAGASVLTLIGTVIAQIIGFRSTRANTEQQIEANHKDTADTLGQQREQIGKTLAEQREQLSRTLKAQSDQLDRTLAEQRTRTLNERFATAAEQLGSDKPAVGLAGVYAMAGLADDWEENRQTCVDVLCAYLRMPFEPDPGEEASEQQRLAFQAIRQVRHTVIRVITAHLKKTLRRPGRA